MIEGLKVTITGLELQKLCAERSGHHSNKAQILREQLPTLDSLQVPNTSNRPGDDARTKIKSHEFKAAEMCFIAAHIVPEETYVLDDNDLLKLGIADRGW
jgi:hypothetical protein